VELEDCEPDKKSRSKAKRKGSVKRKPDVMRVDACVPHCSRARAATDVFCVSLLFHLRESVS
jgi:hypothetical protein